MAYISQEDKKELAPAIKKVLKDFGMKGSISIRHHMSLVVTVTEGILDFTDYFRKGDDGHIQVNTYHLDNFYSGTKRDFLKDLVKAMKGDKWYDKSDAMVDYFDTAYYVDINIGKWNKPYVFTGAKEAA